MAIATARYTIATITLDAVSWTAITPANHCNGWILTNNGSDIMHVRTDSADPNTQFDLGVGQTKQVLQSGLQSPRFPAGSPIFYCQMASGTGPAKVEFVA